MAVFFGEHLVGNGAIKWGTAINTYNNSTALIAVQNAQHFNNLLAGSPSVAPFTWNAGSWGSINLRTGHMTWQLPAFGTDLTTPAFGSSAAAPISFTNQVAFASSSSGYMVAFNSATGAILWTYNTGGNLDSAPAIFNDTLYWGAGYRSTAGGKLYAFSIAPAAAAGRTISAGR